VLAKNGIHVGRTTYQQWRQGKPTMNPQPGDLVFFHMGPKGPEHVGVYIGNDQFIEDPHTGSSVRVSKLSTYPGYCGARTYVSESSSGGKAPVPVDLHGDVAPAGDKPKKTKTHRAAILTGTALLSHGVQLALAKASGTSGTDDDLAALKRARTELEKLQKTASKKEQVPIAKELASINRQINAINKATSDIDNAKVKKKLAEQQAAWKKHLAEQQAAWKKHLAEQEAAGRLRFDALQRVADKARQAFEDSFSRVADQVLKGFDRSPRRVCRRWTRSARNSPRPSRR
jgi:hypothetical protein